MKLTEDEVWINKDGKEVRVADMSESYAKAVLRKILRSHRERQDEAIKKMFKQFIHNQFDIKQRYPV